MASAAAPHSIGFHLDDRGRSYPVVPQAEIRLGHRTVSDMPAGAPIGLTETQFALMKGNSRLTGDCWRVTHLNLESVPAGNCDRRPREDDQLKPATRLGSLLQGHPHSVTDHSP